MDFRRKGFVMDPTKSTHLSLREKQNLVYDIWQCEETASEMLMSWSRRELLQLICIETGKKRKHSGVTKPRMIKFLLKTVSQKSVKKNDETNLNASKKKRNVQAAINTDQDMIHINKEELLGKFICKNAACQAVISVEDKHCKRCSCCICFCYDDNKDPSLWLVCNSDPPYPIDSCGMTCHLKCALRSEKAGISKKGCYSKLDGSFYCVCCGKLNWLIG